MSEFKKMAMITFAAAVGIAHADVSLNGNWDFRFEEDKMLEAAASADFAATDTMTVPGCGAVYGIHDPNASPNTEEYQDEYLRYIFETLWRNPDVVGFAIWQMNDGRTRERHFDKSVSAFFGGSVAGVFDQMRRPKMSATTVRRYFMETMPACLK